MSATSYGWLVLAFPLAGMLVIARSAGAGCPGALPGWIGSARDPRRLPVVDRRADRAPGPARGRALAGRLAPGPTPSTGDFNVDLSILIDPLSVFMCLVVSGVSFLIHVYSVAYMGGDRGYARFFAYLNYFVFSMLLLVLAANFVLLIVGWAFVGAASYLLISFWYRRETATHAGIKAFVMNVIGDVGLVIAAFLLLDKTGALDYAGVFGAAPTGLRPQRRHAGGRLPADPGRRVRQVRAAAAAHLAPGRHGGPHPGLRPDPRGDDGHRRRLPDRAHAPAVRAGPDGRRRQRDHRHGDARVRGHDRARRDRPQARDRLLDDVARSATWSWASRWPPTAPGSST